LPRAVRVSKDQKAKEISLKANYRLPHLEVVMFLLSKVEIVEERVFLFWFFFLLALMYGINSSLMVGAAYTIEADWSINHKGYEASDIGLVRK
jgi:hypothetical protein